MNILPKFDGSTSDQFVTPVSDDDWAEFYLNVHNTPLRDINAEKPVRIECILCHVYYPNALGRTVEEARTFICSHHKKKSVDERFKLSFYGIPRMKKGF